MLLFLAASFYGTRSNAQEDGQTGTEVQELNQQHPELNLSDDKTLLMETDVKASKGQTSTRETGQANLKNKPEGATKPSSEKTEEDPLSFNFLYFIIQKFKISDIVDD